VTTKIRPMNETDEDYEATAAIWTANWPDYPKTGEMYRQSYEMRSEMGIIGRLVAEEAGEIVATGYFREEGDSAAEDKFLVYAQVKPEIQGLGLGSAMFRSLLAHLEEHDPKILKSFTREDHEKGIGFLKRRGFHLSLREVDSKLDLATFDPAAFEDAARKVRESGVEIVSAAGLEARGEDWKRKAWELTGEIIHDVPDDDELTNEPFEAYVKVFDNPDFIPEGYFVAIDAGRYVGTSSVWKRRSRQGELHTRLTGVVRSHRRRGIATALKVRAQSFAKSIGAAAILTDNEENNPMFDLNVSLGFRPERAWLQFRKELDTG
jgi:GNAT superfamily N-acetyltransferase